MTLRRRRPSARPVALSLSSLAVGVLATGLLTASPAAATDVLPATITGTVTAPSNVPGEHHYVVSAWYFNALDGGDGLPVASTELILDSGEKGTYTLSERPPWSVLEAGETYKVRVIESPPGEGVPEIGDQYWKNADQFSTARDVTIPSSASVSGIDFAPSTYAFTSTRVAGEDRYGTSVATTQSFDPGIRVLYVASGEKWADALSAAPAAAREDGALLLTNPSTLPAAVAAEISRLAPTRTIVVGSEATISNAVYGQIEALVGDIERIGGRDRYETSRMIVEEAYGVSPFSAYYVTLATGNNFPDALSVASAAHRAGDPVLLVDGAKDQLDAPTRAAIARLDPYRANIIGQTPSISAGIEQELVSSGLVTVTRRIGGSDRYETSRLINQQWPASALQETTYLASGEGFADALSGATLAAAEGMTVTLSRPDCVPSETVASLKRNQIDTVRLLGSQLTLSRVVESVTSC